MTPVALPQLESRPPTATPCADDAGPLRDSHGRSIRDLRISITDRCNFRCTYCLEPSARFMPRDRLLSVDDIVRIANVAVSLSITKIRLTGGEPTMRAELDEIIERVAACGAIDLALTTNGATLELAALRRWRDAGLNRVTISIDAVDPAAFRRITRATVGPDRVLAGVEATLAAGFSDTKMNAVVVRGENEDQVVPLAGLARRYGIEMRFIEFMPLDDGQRWSADSVVSADEIVRTIQEAFPLTRLGRDEASSTSERYVFADGSAGSIGIIAPVTRSFCGACSRLRITSEGKVRPCLFSNTEWDMRPLLVGNSDDAALRRFLRDATWTKQSGHHISSEQFERPERSMSAIGG
ncbi:MAG: GTP 3',8-cyclase MoaA [Phycisphaerae bacterium]|nr:GTP 3',8-cyclase MoaA [Phycisphaerae bacterium]